MIGSTDEIPGNPEKIDADEVMKSFLMQTSQLSLLKLNKETNLHTITICQIKFSFPICKKWSGNTTKCWQVCVLWQSNKQSLLTGPVIL